MINSLKNTLIIIALTNRAREKIDSGIGFDQLDEALQNLDNVLLFRHKSKNPDKDFLIALPVSGGAHTLLLTKDEGENHFLCVDFWSREVNIDSDPRYCHELSANILCKLVGDSKSVAMYAVDAVDHQQISTEVRGKKEWHPFESASHEERKWDAYLNLYEKIIHQSKVHFWLEDINIKGKKIFARARAHHDGTDASKNDGGEESFYDKISDAKGEWLKFSMHELVERKGQRSTKHKLGKIKSVSTKIEIDMDKDFRKSLKGSLGNSAHLQDGQEVRCEYVSDADVHDFTAQQMDFYQDGEKIFTAKAILEKQGNSQIAKIITNSVLPHRLFCSIDFFGEEYQIGVMKNAFNEVKDLPIWQVLSGKRVAKLPALREIVFDNRKLNAEQRKAIEGALSAPELFLIWGPPGTGKTEVIKEIAKREALQGNKTLICSQANLAVDNALARLHDTPEAYPFRIAKEGYTMEGEDVARVPFENSSPRFFIEKMQRALSQLAKNSNDDNAKLREKFLRQLNKAHSMHANSNKSVAELREFRQFAMLYRDRINVVGSTLMESGKKIKGGGNKLLDTTGIEEFDTVIIDEVSKATPPELFIPIALGKRLVLVGDHKQLPPMFKMLSGDDRAQEEWAEEAGVDASELDVDNTIFERLWERHTGDSSPVRAMLTKQYRMHPQIEELIRPFYTDSEGELSCGLFQEDIEKLALRGVPLFESRPAMWVRAQQNFFEERVGTSFTNDDEIDNVGKLLTHLAKLGDRSLSVGVITFYGAQLRKLKQKYEHHHYTSMFGPGKLTFGTVDRFQGRECDVVICSLVRNNRSKNIGFASKPNRINVAFSRARRMLIILGSEEAFCYEQRNKKAQSIYKGVYANCHQPKPKELNQ